MIHVLEGFGVDLGDLVVDQEQGLAVALEGTVATQLLCFHIPSKQALYDTDVRQDMALHRACGCL